MPLQNRVTPFGDIVATPERGTLFGNRGGRFHDPATRSLAKRRFASRRWICCELRFKDRRRAVFGKGYTELFFLDEATALAAGHRPCFECRRAEAVSFREAFALGNRLEASPLADEMDRRLHAERRSPRPAIDDWRSLPDGAMVAQGTGASLVLSGALLPWTPAGYLPASNLPRMPLFLLTPPAIVAALRAGYSPRLHPSAREAHRTSVSR
ncbi:MAG: hypothetical protein ACHQAY_12790 [Hyphomicrobiales bacterium]